MSDDIKPIERFELKASDAQSETWKRLKRHLEDRLAHWRKQNDAPQHDAVATAHIRGRIETYKLLLELEKNPPPG